VIILALIFGCSLLAQTSLSTIRGTAKDQSGSVVPGASIAVTHLERGLERKVLTNDAGEFEVPDLNWGTYRLTAMAPGFTTFIANDIALESGQIRRVNVVFQIGEVTSQVTVREGAAVIATEGSKIASSFTHRRIEENPIYGDGRNPILILTTMPFVQSY
jgi:hypothetical protein